MTTKKPLRLAADDRAWGASMLAGTRVPADTLFETWTPVRRSRSSSSSSRP